MADDCPFRHVGGLKLHGERVATLTLVILLKVECFQPMLYVEVSKQRGFRSH